MQSIVNSSSDPVYIGYSDQIAALLAHDEDATPPIVLKTIIRIVIEDQAPVPA